MPGILRNYKAGSIIYFVGDIGDNIYVLKSGAVSLIYHSIDTGEEVRDTINNGEFFGVKSALAKRPRDETALVIKPSQVLVLTTAEFELLKEKGFDAEEIKRRFRIHHGSGMMKPLKKLLGVL